MGISRSFFIAKHHFSTKLKKMAGDRRPNSILPTIFGEMSELVEGARLESVCMGNCTKGSNPFLSATFRVGSRAIESCEPRQIRKEATVSNVFGVPRITQLFFRKIINL